MISALWQKSKYKSKFNFELKKKSNEIQVKIQSRIFFEKKSNFHVSIWKHENLILMYQLIYQSIENLMYQLLM